MSRVFRIFAVNLLRDSLFFFFSASISAQINLSRQDRDKFLRNQPCARADGRGRGRGRREAIPLAFVLNGDTNYVQSGEIEQ